MSPNLTQAATAVVGTKLLRGFRFRWIVYGAAVYYGLRLMSKRGIFPKQADAALDVIDRGLDVAKRQVGFGGSKGILSDQSSLSH